MPVSLINAETCKQLCQIHPPTATFCYVDLDGAVPADILTKEQLVTRFPTPESLLGPALLVQSKIYGRDLIYPVPSNVSTAAAHIIKYVVDEVQGARVQQMWTSASVPAPQEHNRTGKMR